MIDLGTDVTDASAAGSYMMATTDAPKLRRVGTMTAKDGESTQQDGVYHGPMQRAEQSPDKNDYATPPKLWRPLANAVDGFDVDPCSGAEDTPIADTRYTEEDNGLEKPWHGDVFVNPPWSSNGDASAKLQWLRKARGEAHREAVDSVTMLLPSDTSAGWFHKHVMAAPIVCFVGPGRISFVGADRNPSFGLLIPVYGDDAHKLREPLDGFGIVVDGKAVYQPNPQTTLVSAMGGGNSRQRDTENSP